VSWEHETDLVKTYRSMPVAVVNHTGRMHQFI